MRWILPALLLTAAVLPLSATRADTEDAAKALFESRCATCHAIPDPGLRWDRVWLDQVKRTT